MELRTYNVERVYSECVKCRIGEDLGVDSDKLKQNEDRIKSMLSQIKTDNGYVYVHQCNRRTDGETWTPYIQIIELLLLLGRKIGVVKYEGKLNGNTLIYIDYGKEGNNND